MKIVMICEFFDNELQYQENLLTKYYIKNNHEVVVITSLYDSIFDFYNDSPIKIKQNKKENHANLTIYRCKYEYNLFNRLRKFENVKEIFDKENPELIFIHDIQPNLKEATSFIKRNTNCKLIMDFHADYSNSANGWLSLNILHKILRKKLYLDPAKKYISKFFPVVPASTKFLNEVYDVSLDRMELLPLGSDTDYGEIVKKNKEGEKIRVKLNIPQDHVVIFSGGKLQGPKKTELLIDAFLKINKENLHLIIIGEASNQDQEYKETLLKLADNHPRIYFIGWLKSADVYKYIDACDLAVFPASQSILWQQAISMGLPLIAGDTGDQSIDYLNEDNNIVVLPNEKITSEEILKEIHNIIDNKNTLELMKRGAQKATDIHLNWNNLILKTLQFNI
jgi:1,2-diacylglycerol 3-alpha-glucosyltransferase